MLSQQLLHGMETANQQQKTTTRIEVEVTENVTKILKTYIIGERNDQMTVAAADEISRGTYEREVLPSSRDFTEKEYTDVLEKEAIASRPSSDVNFFFEGHHYKDRSEIRPHQRTGSEASTTSESITQKRIPSPCIYTNVECTLKRTEDYSLNEVNVAMPNTFSAVLSLIRERIPQLPNLVTYGMEQRGKQYSGETTIRRLHRFESTDSFDEAQKNQKEPSFLFEKPQIIEPVKIPVLNITELDLRRMADTSAILANFAIPRTDQSQLDIERRYKFHEAQGRSYGMQQKGQHFEGEMILKKKRRFSSESESVSEEDICGPTYLNLTKQEARGEFDVVIIIPNDQRTSPKHFQESQPTANSNAIIAIQKAVHLDDIFQQNIRSWKDKRTERTVASFSEFVKEQVQVVIFLQRAGIMYGQVQREWPEAVTGRLKTTCTTISPTITISKNSNIFKAVTESSSIMTNTDFPSTNLTDINTTTKHFHLSNFKTILPTHSMAQRIFPLTDIATVSMDLSTKQIPENSDEIRVRIAHEFCNIDEIKQQINKEEGSLQMHVKRMNISNDDDEGHLEEMLDTFWIACDSDTHEASAVMKSQRSHNDLSNETNLSLSLHTTLQCVQDGTELSFSSDSRNEHRKPCEQATLNVDYMKKTTDIRVMRTNEIKTENAKDTHKIFHQPIQRTKGGRVIPIRRISAIDSGTINGRKERFIDAQEQHMTETRSLRTSSLADPDSYRTTDYSFRGTEQINYSRKMKEFFGESKSYLRNSSHNESQWQEAMSPSNNVREAFLTWNSTGSSNEQQFAYGEQSKQMYLSESFCDMQQEEHRKLHTFPRVEQQFKGNLYNTTSEIRVAMLHAGFDLDTTLLATPEMETPLTFAKDRSLTTSEYFSDERSWTATTESYYKQYIDQVSRSADDLCESSLGENSEIFNEVSHISDGTYNYLGHNEIANLEKISFQKTRSLTTSLESSELKKFLVETKDEFSIVPETCECDVTIGKSEQYEASSVAFQTKYHTLTQPIKTAEEALIVKKKEGTDLKINEITEKRRDSMFWRTNIRDIQVEAPSLGLEYKNEIYQETTKETMGITQHMILEPVQNNVATIDTRRRTVEIYKQEVEHNIGEIGNVSQALSTLPEMITEESVQKQEMNDTDSLSTSVKVMQPNKKAWGETAPISRDLVSAMTSGETSGRLSFQERNSQFNSVVHFPLKPMKGTIAATEKAALVVNEKSLRAIKMIPQATQTESIGNSDFFDYSETLYGKEVVFDIPELEVTTKTEAVEQIAEEAINISVGCSQEQAGVSREYGPHAMETVTDFAKILMEKTENEMEISNGINLHWEKCLDSEAVRECVVNLEQLLVKVGPVGMVQHIYRGANYENVAVDFIASSEMHETSVIMFDKQLQCQLPEITSENMKQEQYEVQSEILKSVDATRMSIMNDICTAISICESNIEQVTLNAVFSQELQLENRNILCMIPSYEYDSTHFRLITAISGDERQFRIESKMKESTLVCQQKIFAEKPAVLDAENLTESVAEMHSDAAIFLTRRSAKMTTEATSRVVGAVLTLSQDLTTSHAKETSEETSMNFSIPTSNLEVEANICQYIVNRDNVSLDTKYAKAIALQEIVELTKSRKVSAETGSILREDHTEALLERLKESDWESFEILSQWTTVDRDLEAEVRLLDRHNIDSRFSTKAISEEEASTGETWVAAESNVETCAIRNVIASECCQSSFQIEFDEVKIWLKNLEKEGSSEIFWCDKNYDVLYASMRGSILEKLSVVINLCRVSNVLPKQTANEYIWRDQQLLVAIPLYVKREDIETDFTTVDICLEHEVAQKYLETVRISANWMRTEIFECEEAGEEKMHMAVELQGARLAPSGTEVIWPEARRGDGVIVDMEEYRENQAALYVQLASKQIRFADFNTTIITSQDYEPQMLITYTTKEEFVDEYDEFRIMPEEKAITHVMIIGNRGECLSIWLQETKQNFITVGFQYSEEDQGDEIEENFVEKRFGGNYQLVTKAVQAEYRSANMAMLREIENEAVIEVLKENVRNSSSIEVLASTREVTLIDINWEKASQTALTFTQRSCPRKAEPIRNRFLEVGEIMHTVHAQFKIKEASKKSSVIWKVPNYGGHLMLNTGSAEETILDHEIEYRKDETSETTIKTLKQVVSTEIAPTFSTQCITEVIEDIRMDLVRQSPIDRANLVLRQANRGVNIEVKLIETKDIRESSYLQLTRESESVELEKVIKEARFAGKLNFAAATSEECEFDASRELIFINTRKAHCSQLVVSKNWSRGTYCEVLATKSESADVQIDLRNSESTDDANRTVHQKPVMRNTLIIQESEAVVLTINLNFIRQRQKAKEISEKTIWLARDSEPCILTTSATTIEQKLVQWILEKRRDTLLGASARISVKNFAKVLPLSTIQSESVEIVVCANLQRTVEMLEVCKTLIAPNRGYDERWKLRETCDENECSNYQFKHENAAEQVEAILRQPYYGGHSILTTFAVKKCEVGVTSGLESKLPIKSEISISFNTSNKTLPIVFSTKAAVSVETNKIITLAKEPEAKEVGIIQKIANVDTAKIAVAEIRLEAENVIIKYQHREECAEIQGIIFIALYGGHQKLETLAANEITINIYKELMSKRPMFAEACLHQVVANVTNPCKLSTQSSKLEETNQEQHLLKKRVSENEVSLMSRAANYEFSKFNTTESMNETETIIIHWQRDGKYEEVHLCISDKRFGGSSVLSTNFAQEFSIMLAAALTASHSSLAGVIFTIPIARYSAEQPMLATSSITEMYAELSCYLNHPSTGQKSTTTLHTANQIEAMNVQLTESTIISQTTNIQYQRSNLVVDTFSEVFAEARFGGSLFLNTLAARETSISVHSLHSFQGPKQLEAQIVFVDKNRASEMCHVLATTEKTITASAQLQKLSDLSSAEIMKRASRKGVNQYFKFKEPSEISQFNNFFWKNPAKTVAGQVVILKEIRYGGHLELSTGYATEQAVTTMNTLKQTSVELNFTASVKTANQGESVNIFCSASQDNYTSISLELQSKKLAQFEVSISRKAANHGVPQKLIASETSELALTTNVAMQNSVDYESAQFIWKTKNQGGIIELQCNASKESYTEVYSCLKSRISSDQYVGGILIIHETHYGEHIAMNLMATEETIFNFEVSFDKQDVESKQSYTIKAINVTLAEVLNTMESLESAIEIEKVEVWKHLSEEHVESALKLTKQCLSVSLQTDSAEETFIRHEFEMRVDNRRAGGMAEEEEEKVEKRYLSELKIFLFYYFWKIALITANCCN